MAIRHLACLVGTIPSWQEPADTSSWGLSIYVRMEVK